MKFAHVRCIDQTAGNSTTSCKGNSIKSNTRLAFVFAALLSSTAVHAGNAAAEFSASSNPAGAWSYGWTDTLGSSFTLFTNQTSYDGKDFWYGNQPPFGGSPGYPTVLRSNAVPSDMLLEHPGPAGEYAVLRWTSPVDQTVGVSAEFTAQDPHPTSTDVHLLLNGVSLLSGLINSASDTVSFLQAMSFKQGDKLDFAVGYGSNNNYFYDTTGIRATVGPVPEPTTVSLCLAGLLFVVWRARTSVRARSAEA